MVRVWKPLKYRSFTYREPWHIFRWTRFSASENGRSFRWTATVDERTVHGECEIRGKRQGIVRLLESSQFLCRWTRFRCTRYLILSPSCLCSAGQVSSSTICMIPSSVFDSTCHFYAPFILYFSRGAPALIFTACAFILITADNVYERLELLGNSCFPITFKWIRLHWIMIRVL